MIKKRHVVVYTLLKPLFYLYLKLAYRYKAEHWQTDEKHQAKFILANHNCNLDPVFLAISFRDPIYFVASDHLFRLGLISKVIHFLVAPIPIVKSQLDLKTLRMIRETIGAGGSVCLFPEGNRSFNGRTGFISPATGKLAKQMKCPLVLYRIDGGYLSTPRWGRTRRKGRMRGYVARVLQVDELATLSPSAIQQIIEDTLYTDAYADQQKEPIAYQGKYLAEHVEISLFVCPRCEKLNTIQSHDDLVFCTCGLKVKIDVYGFFHPLDDWSKGQQEKQQFLDQVLKWDDWQQDWLHQQMAQKAVWLRDTEPCLFFDEYQVLSMTKRALSQEILATGRLSLYVDRLVFESSNQKNSQKQGQDETFIFPLSEIQRMIVHGPKTLQFTTRLDKTYEIKSKHWRSAYKYTVLFDLLTRVWKDQHKGT